MFAFSGLFSVEMVGASFDAMIERDASNGRISAMFSEALTSAYGLELPASPTKAIVFINEVLGLEKAPKIAQGPGARANARAVVQALHALALALYEGGKVKSLPTVAPLPDWANDEIAAAKAAAAATKRAATKAAKAAAAAPAAAAPAAAAPAAAPAAAKIPTTDFDSAFGIVYQAIKAGTLPAGMIAALKQALQETIKA